MNFELLNSTKLQKFFLLTIFISCLILMIIFAFGLNSSKLQSSSDLNQQLINCENPVLNNFTNIAKKEYRVIEVKKDVYLFPEIKNFLCLGQIIGYEINTQDSNMTLYIGSSSKFFNLINFFGNFILCLLVLLSKKRKNLELIFFYFLFNYLSYQLFNYVDFSYRAFFPILIAEESTYQYFFHNIFIISVSLKSRKNLYIILSFYFFVLLSVDYFGLFLIILYFVSKFQFEFNRFEKNTIIAAPIIFYVSRIISSLFEGLGYLWIHTGQRVYRGYTTYADLKATLFGLKCNSDPNSKISFGVDQTKLIECYDLRGGPLDSYLSINGDVNFLASVIGSISIFLLIVLYIILLKHFSEYYFLLSVFFLSPPMNHLTFYGNDDIIILLISAICLVNFHKFSFLKLIFLLLASLLNLHPAPALIGLLVVSFSKKDYKLFSYSAMANILFAGLFLLDLYQNNKNIDNTWLAPGYGYGFYLDILLLQKYLNTTFLISFIIILFSLYFLNKFFVKKKNLYIVLEEKYSSYFYIPFILWFLVSFLYTNNTYRIALYLGLLFIAFIKSSDTVKILILFFVFLEPVIFTSYFFVQLLFMTASNISSYILFILFLNYLVNYILKNFYKVS